MITFSFITLVERILCGEPDTGTRHFVPNDNDTWFVLDSLERLSTKEVSSFRVKDIAKTVRASGYRMSTEDVSDTCSYHTTRGDIQRIGEHEPRYALTEKGRKFLHLK